MRLASLQDNEWSPHLGAVYCFLREYKLRADTVSGKRVLAELLGCALCKARLVCLRILFPVHVQPHRFIQDRGAERLS